VPVLHWDNCFNGNLWCECYLKCYWSYTMIIVEYPRKGTIWGLVLYEISIHLFVHYIDTVLRLSDKTI
jgi:hypothetical protein